MASDRLIISKLGAAGQDQVSRFRMSEEDDRALQIFIRSHARKSAAANLTQTYVAKLEGDPRIIGYVSLMCAEVALEKTYALDDKTGADRFEYHPAVRIARLAVADGHRGQGVGTRLLEAAMGVVLVGIVPSAGCRFLILDAKRKSIPFYQQHGFRLLDTPENHAKANPLMFLDLRNLITGETAA